MGNLSFLMKKNSFFGGCYLGHKLRCKKMQKIWFGPFWAKKWAKKGKKGPKNTKMSKALEILPPDEFLILLHLSMGMYMVI